MGNDKGLGGADFQGSVRCPFTACIDHFHVVLLKGILHRDTIAVLLKPCRQRSDGIPFAHISVQVDQCHRLVGEFRRRGAGAAVDYRYGAGDERH